MTKKKFILTAENYHSKEANELYMGSSQIKTFLDCPARALAELEGRWERKPSNALLLGSYVDNLLTDEAELETLISKNYSEIYTQKGELRADFQRAYETVQRVKQEPLMMEYLTGEHQTIMTAEIEGVLFKIKMDTYREGKWISDLKYMRSLRSPNLFEPMILYWGYDIQSAIYQEVVFKNTGKRLPFYFVIATKETPARFAVALIPQEDLDDAMNRIRPHIKDFYEMKQRHIKAEPCGLYDCDYCALLPLTGIIDTNFLSMPKRETEEIDG